MKLIFAIINNDDSAAVISALTRENFYVTKLSTTGGFLSAGNTTLLIGSEADRVDQADALIHEYSKARTRKPSSSDSLGKGLADSGMPEEVTVGGATVFILGVEKMSKY